jgi:hypothetical protein
MPTNMEEPMSENAEKLSEKLEEASAMADASSSARARALMVAIAGPRAESDTRGTWLGRAARRCGLSPRRAKALFYGEKTRITADEFTRLQERFDALREGIAKYRDAVATLRDLARDGKDRSSGVAARSGGD